MAELLIKAIDATHPDPEKDARGCYKRGDVVAVRPSGFTWGRKEALAPADGGKFVIVEIRNLTPAQLRTAIRNKWGIEPDDHDGTTRRRRIRIDADLLPLAVRQQLHQTGRYSATYTQVRNFIRNKLNNETA